MKILSIISLSFMLTFSVNAQSYSSKKTVPALDPMEWEAGVNLLSNPMSNIDSDHLHQFRPGSSLYPNPVNVGDNVLLTNITQGEMVFIYEPNGRFITSQYIDLDKQIYTNNLIAGEYVIRANDVYLKLLVE